MAGRGGKRKSSKITAHGHRPNFIPISTKLISVTLSHQDASFDTIYDPILALKKGKSKMADTAKTSNFNVKRLNTPKNIKFHEKISIKLQTAIKTAKSCRPSSSGKKL